MSRSRVVLLGILLVVGLLEAQALVMNMHWHRLARDTVAGALRQAIARVRPRLGAALAPGGAPAWSAAAADLLATGLGDGVEVVSMDGRRLFARPDPPVAARAPGPLDVERLRADYVVVTMAADGTRLVTQARFRSGEEDVVLRLATPVPELAAELEERRQVLVALGLGLVLVLVAGALVAAPARPSEASPPRALLAYEEAMDLLRERGEQASLRHDEERRRLAGEIEDKEALARAGELTAGIVHEVRNGLGTIVGYARLLEGVPGAAEDAKSIREECDTLETVVRRFVDFVKRETLTVTTFDLGRMLSRVAAREGRRGGGPEVQVEAAEAGTLEGDEELLERAFENLVRNAREAAGPGGRVVVTAARERGRVRVSVSDDGPGLSRETRDALRPFFTTKAGGLGLGLAIALKLVRLHGGEIGFEPRAPRGTRVVVVLPTGG